MASFLNEELMGTNLDIPEGEIKIDGKNPYFVEKDGGIYSTSGEIIMAPKGETTVTVPPQITTIKPGSFDNTVESVVFASDTLLGDVTSISETLYMNGKDKEVVSDTVVKYDGQDLSGRIFINKGKPL